MAGCAQKPLHKRLFCHFSATGPRARRRQTAKSGLIDAESRAPLLREICMQKRGQHPESESIIPTPSLSGAWKMQKAAIKMGHNSGARALKAQAAVHAGYLRKRDKEISKNNSLIIRKLDKCGKIAHPASKRERAYGPGTQKERCSFCVHISTFDKQQNCERTCAGTDCQRNAPKHRQIF